MAGRFRRQPSSMLEIRGISRGSLVDHPTVEPVNEMPELSKDTYYYSPLRPSLDLNSDDDDDESTVVGGSQGRRSTSPHSTSQTDETVTYSDETHYWSAGNSFTTGNTTERSSVYSWGDDEFDLQASKMVRQMFQAIERMLFEGVLSGSTSLQHECREWMAAFPHLRILGKQVLPSRDEGYQIVSSRGEGESSVTAITFDDLLEVKGTSMTPSHAPHQQLPHEQEGGKASGAEDYSHLFEEVFAEDGNVEEYLAYDIREMDEEEHSKKYYVPRRRRLGFPPITPNACVRDAVLHHVFDTVWSQVVGCLSGPTKTKPTSLLKLLVQNLTWQYEKNLQALGANNSADGKNTSDSDVSAVDPRSRQISHHTYYPFENIDCSQNFWSVITMESGPCAASQDDDDLEYTRPGITMERVGGHGVHPGASLMMPPLSINPRLLYPDSAGLPPSRGSYLDQAAIGGRHMPFSSGRLSTAPYQNTSDINSLNDVMKISQKIIQPRSIPNEDMSPGPLPDARLSGRPSSSHFINGSNLNGPNNQLGSINHHLSAIGIGGTSSPLTTSNRPFTSRDFLPRQQSATRKGRGGRLARLMPLDRAKTPNVDFDGLNVKATKLVPGHMEPPVSYSGLRVNSPPHNFQPPPTAPNPSTGSGLLWVNSRLPPINSSLESLPENTLSDFKKTRLKTAYTRISSAIEDDKGAGKGLDNISRPNTTHTFRADNPVLKRAASVTPSNFVFGAQGNSIAIPGLKSGNPAGAGIALLSSSGAPSVAHPQHPPGSPDNVAGLVGITGRSIHLGINSFQSASPEEQPGPPQASWGPPSQSINTSQARRKKQVLI